MNENIEKVLAVLDGFRMSNEMTYSAYSVLHDEISMLDDLLKALEQEIQQLRKTHISVSDNAIACGVINGGVVIHQKANEITNIKHVEVFNG